MYNVTLKIGLISKNTNGQTNHFTTVVTQACFPRYYEIRNKIYKNEFHRFNFNRNLLHEKCDSHLRETTVLNIYTSRATKTRIMSGLFMGFLGTLTAILGGWPFAIMVGSIAYQASQEFFGFIAAIDLAKDCQPLSTTISTIVVFACVIQVMTTQITCGLTSLVYGLTTFGILVVQILTASERPYISQFMSTMFGLFYCGFLLSFWLKLRLINTPLIVAPHMPGTLYWLLSAKKIEHLTTGLVTTIMAAVCVVATDITAFSIGSKFGTTQLTKISPNKTFEGATGGLFGSIFICIGLGKIIGDPVAFVWYAIFGGSIFLGSLFGDLIESVMKRDSGLKDSGTLIPGHGGLLDRIDSYMFTGVMVYFLTKFYIAV